ncbi:Hypothetical protein CINCED_3A009965 [Cinara cedri]|uniref:Uncharacterized protein n=1 Tax=Cinara cedri TaxID=506608 RepID=A0A5E4M3V1_9HEMI|nr:Hypothetical protein CINCED_3A009965 [Cinara cedri]
MFGNDLNGLRLTAIRRCMRGGRSSQVNISGTFHPFINRWDEVEQEEECKPKYYKIIVVDIVVMYIQYVKIIEALRRAVYAKKNRRSAKTFGRRFDVVWIRDILDCFAAR